MCSSLGMLVSAACGTPLPDFETPPSPSPPLSIRPAWYRGRMACMEISLATVVALALCGRRAHWVLGARQLPTEAHAWVWTENGAFGLSGRDRPDPRRPWIGAVAAPPVPHARKGEL
ncbi:lasso peptide biosynthesis B2 protein [Streptomyces sp. S5]|uniref:lasso peptide biosynthesis B2 protein n=1 Tax=Streptomyces sp. S5 TaxID=1456735 RepID=UPI000EF87CC1|nr:lasso peptide biosynthesis B2 protein [Streptomyces sp. S5]